MRSTNSLLTLLSLVACFLFVLGVSVNAAPAPELDALTNALEQVKSPPSTNDKHIKTTQKGQPAAQDYGWGGNRDVYWKKSNNEELAHLEERAASTVKSSHKATSHKHSKSSSKSTKKEGKTTTTKKMNKVKSSAGGANGAKKPAEKASGGSTGSGVQPAGDWGFAGGWGTYY